MQIKTFSSALLLAVAGICGNVQATIVQFQTSIGDFTVNLFDKDAPKTVENFLQYVEDGAYDDTVIHRSVRNFVVQGGGYTFDYDEQKFKAITTRAAVVNEPKYSNREGTIAMAKLGDNPNSATSQWFFNMADNSANLDYQNGGFTVFGQTDAAGMEILKKLLEMRHVSDIPLANYSDMDVLNKTPLEQDNLVTITSVVVIDASPDTAAEPKPEVIAPQAAQGKKKSSGASDSALLMLMGVLFMWRRLGRKNR